MSFSKCCTSIKNIACVTHCEELNTELPFVQGGIHTIEAFWLDAVIMQDVDSTEGAITFPNRYNEVSEILFKIKQPDGSYYVDEDGNDCFKFTNSIGIVI